MTVGDLYALISPGSNWERFSPATDQEIASAKAHLPTALPTDYFDFFRISDGGYGPLPVAPWRFGLFRIGEVGSTGYEKFVPAFLLVIGSNGGDTLLVFDLRHDNPPVCMIEVLNEGEQELEIVCSDFRELVALMGKEDPADND